MENIKKHPAILFSNELSTICIPLKKLHISYFSHVHINSNQEFSALCTNPGFTEHYLQNKRYNADINLAVNKQKLNDFLIWDSINCSGKTLELYKEASEFGIKHIFTLIEKNPKSTDFYHFATNNSSSTINQVYVEKLDLLKLFILYFKESIKAAPELLKAYDYRFNIHKNAKFQFSAPRFVNPHNDAQEFIEALLAQYTTLLKKNLIYLSQNSLLTPREKICLQHTMKGNTAKQIAKILKISPRTVELHIANIKNKFQVNNKIQLFNKVNLSLLKDEQ